MGLTYPLIPWRTTRGNDSHSIYQEFHLKKDILKVKYYKQQINTHKVNQIEEGLGERRRTCDGIRDLWAETVAREEVAWMGVGTKEKIMATEAATRKREIGGNCGRLTNATILKQSSPSIASQTVEERSGPPICQKHHRRPSCFVPAKFSTPDWLKTMSLTSDWVRVNW